MFLVSVVYYRVYYLIRRVEICIGLGELCFCSPIIVSNSLKFTEIMLIILEIILVFNIINNVVLANLYMTIIVKGTVSLDKQPRFLRITIGSCG